MPAPLTPSQRRYLSRHVCAWCDQPLSRPECGAVHEPCSPDLRAERQAKCLQGFKPRGPKPPPGSPPWP